jgi:hypothetical protein
MLVVTNYHSKERHMFKLTRGTTVASVALAAGVTGTVLDPDGPIGITLFGVAIAAALYLLARPFRNSCRGLVGARARRPLPQRAMPVMRRRTVAIVAAMGALFALWLLGDLSRPLTYACWWGFCLLAAWLTASTLLAARRLQQGAPRSPGA